MKKTAKPPNTLSQLLTVVDIMYSATRARFPRSGRCRAVSGADGAHVRRPKRSDVPGIMGKEPPRTRNPNLIGGTTDVFDSTSEHELYRMT